MHILNGNRRWLSAFLISLAGLYGQASAENLDIVAGDAVLSVTDTARLSALGFSDGTQFTSGSVRSLACLEVGMKEIAVSSIFRRRDRYAFKFDDGSSITVSASDQSGFSLFRLLSMDLKSSATGLRLFEVAVPRDARIDSTLNTAFYNGKAVGLMAATPEVLAVSRHSQQRSADLAGCNHSLTQTTQSKEGAFAAQFSAQCSLPGSGWSMEGRAMENDLNIVSVVGLSAWIYGDGKGEQLKFQLTDEGGGARDYYVPVNFTGWRKVEMTSAALNIVRGKKLAGLNLYYNGIPAKTAVSCAIDDVRTLIYDGSTTRSESLESFEDRNSPWWNDGHTALSLYWDFRHAGVGDAFGVIACAESAFFETVKRFEKLAGIVTPYPGGEWNKKSTVINESYLFLTSFSENQFDEAVALAKRGGFKRVLLGQESWCQSTGHYEIKRTNFPDGLPGLVKTVERFRAEGIDVGLHLLGASIDWNDPYLTPVPDPRLVKDGTTTLVTELDVAATSVVVESISDKFPAEDGGYNGDGTVLQIGTELIKYAAKTTTAPYVFTGCERGYLGTQAAAHKAGETVEHLARSYGYHMFDMDTSMLGEVTSNFAEVANACNIGMVYFDGSERLQGEHQRYNGRLINAYIQKLHNKDILVQASSFSHFSWHQLARSASADGHGDLKGYLEQRSPSFKSFAQSGMPLDIGWYYGYDLSATPDMYEYILGTTIGYDSSFSYQVSVAAAKQHPFTAAILDLIKRYEGLRLSGRVPAEMKALLRVPKELEGKAPEDPTRNNAFRRDYRLTRDGSDDVFQRVVYGDWQTTKDAAAGLEWEIDVTSEPVLLGIQMQVLAEKSGQSETSGTKEKRLVNPRVKVGGRHLEWSGEVKAGQYMMFWPGEPISIHGQSAIANPTSQMIAPAITLPAGKHVLRFDCESGSQLPVRIRTTLQLPERYTIPKTLH